MDRPFNHIDKKKTEFDNISSLLPEFSNRLALTYVANQIVVKAFPASISD